MLKYKIYLPQPIVARKLAEYFARVNYDVNRSEEYKMDIGIKIKNLREEKGLS